MTLHILDGSAFIHRYFHAYPKFSRSDGQASGAVYGICDRLLKADLEREWDSHVVVALDVGRRTFRHIMDASYKADRGPTAPDLVSQMQLALRAFAVFGLPCVGSPGYEADDVIATLAKQWSGPVTIHTVDKDLYQLVDKRVTIRCLATRAHIDEAAVVKKFGVPASRVADYLALVGDASDNVPGVVGIGPKGAAAIIQKYGAMVNILARSRTEPVCPLLKALSVEHQQNQAALSLSLVSLVDNAPLKTERHQPWQPAEGKSVRAFLDEMEFVSLSGRQQEAEMAR